MKTTKIKPLPISISQRSLNNRRNRAVARYQEAREVGSETGMKFWQKELEALRAWPHGKKAQ